METKYDFLIGKRITSLKSNYAFVEFYSHTEISYRFDYLATMICRKNFKSLHTIEINSRWEETEKGYDLLNMDFLYEGISDYRNYPDNNRRLPSLTFVEGFLVDKVEVYGYDINFNLIAPTDHILLLTSDTGDQLLIRPEPCTMGLVVDISPRLIANFFKNCFSEYIYKVY